MALGALQEMAGGGNGAVDGAAAALFGGGIAARTKGKVVWWFTRPLPSLATRPSRSGRGLTDRASVASLSGWRRRSPNQL